MTAAARTANFDEAAAEVFGPPPELVAFGETIVLPRELPAVVVLMQERSSMDDEASERDIRDVLALIVGEEQVTTWVDVHRIGVDGLYLMLRTIGSAYGKRRGADPEPSAPATGRARKAPAKAKAARSRTSSKRGTPSKRTSAASTAST